MEVVVLDRLAEVDRRAKAGAIHGRVGEMLDRRGLGDAVARVQESIMAGDALTRWYGAARVPVA
ncbi:hypothetical protein F8568_013455 [Actinomadura sp. LD22]|uniref:Uncharacterized protein n=1 Tax=Actinomadura physcomitrii TaxID=2650748 RepID=A0A6I4M710_9ACTN|nr:hypothetical protein [Actinomadura physcomitrii]MWA01372.1 hypothetical protein [Actinomadura physcomitrii]